MPDLPLTKIVTSFFLGSAYGRQMAMGAGRFRHKRLDWIMINNPIDMLDGLAPNSAAGAVGQFHSEAHLHLLKQKGVPYLVSTTSRADPSRWLRIVPDNAAVGRMAAEYFIRKRYQQFAVIYMEVPFLIERTEAFVDCLREHGFGNIITMDYSVIRRLSGNDFQPPVAVFAPTDAAAMVLMNQLALNRIRMPEDVAILGVDNDPMISTFAPVSLSSVELPYEAIGFTACEALEKMVETGRQITGSEVHPPVGVIERRSSASQPVTDPRVRRAIRTIEDNLRELQNIDTLALELAINRRTLDRLFERHLGMTAASYVLRHRASRAERLLRETDYTVDYVADLVGFADRRGLYRALKSLGRPLPRALRAEKSR